MIAERTIRRPHLLRTGFAIQVRLSALEAWIQVHRGEILRISLGLIFLLFGTLKLIPGASPAEALAGKTINALSMGLLSPAFASPLLGLIECSIGALLMTRRTRRCGAILVVLHMLGTFAPLVLFPGETFSHSVFPTLEGQYILKNLVFLAVGAVLATGP